MKEFSEKLYNIGIETISEKRAKIQPDCNKDEIFDSVVIAVREYLSDGKNDSLYDILEKCVIPYFVKTDNKVDYDFSELVESFLIDDEFHRQILGINKDNFYVSDETVFDIYPIS